MKMKDNRLLLSEIKLAFSKNDKEKLEKLISHTPFAGIKDASFHIEVGKILSALGKVELTKRELELSIRDNPDNISPYITLSELYIEDGEYQKGIDLLKKGIERFPEEEELYIKLGDLYVLRGEIGALKALYKLAYEKTENPYFKAKISDIHEEEQTEVFEPNNIHITKFLSLFRGREGVYARQWIDDKGNTGYSPIREPFTLKIAKNHLIGTYTIGLYQLREDNTIEFIVFDIDVVKRFLKDYFSSQKTNKKIKALLRDVTLEIYRFLRENRINAYIEDSGFKGYHIWIFLKEPIPAALGKAFGRYVLEKLKVDEEMIHIEIFPKQTSLKSKDMLGNLIKLPLGIHKRSGIRSTFLDENFNSPSDQFSFLLDIEKTNKELIRELYEKLASELPPIELKEKEVKEKEEKEFFIEDDKEFNILLRRCPVIKAIWDKVSAGAGLSSEETMVVIFTLGHLTNGPKVVNTILRKAGIFNEKSYLKSKLNGYPMSCGKIRKKIPYITANTCRDCFSNLDIGTYPTPLLHLKEFEKEDKDIEAVVFEYVDTLKKYKILKVNLEKAKEMIFSYMDERGIDKIEVNNFIIERTEDGDNLYFRTGLNSDQKT